MSEVFRNDLIKKIHVAKNSLGLAEDDYRALLDKTTGKESCKDMDLLELNQVMDQMRRLGFVEHVKRSGTRRKIQNSPMQKKILKLWYILDEHHKVNGAIKSLNTFIKRQTGIESLEWVKSHDEAKKVIEALKAFATREGVVLR